MYDGPFHTEAFSRIFTILHRIEKKVNTMAESQADFDTLLGQFLQSVSNLETVVTEAVAAIAAKVPPTVDLTSEAASITAAAAPLAAAAQALQNALTPPASTPPASS